MIQSERVHIKMITYTGQKLKQPKNNEVIQAHNKKKSDQYTSDCEKVGYIL